MEPPFQVVVPIEKPLVQDAKGTFVVPEGTPVAVREPAKRRSTSRRRELRSRS